MSRSLVRLLATVAVARHRTLYIGSAISTRVATRARWIRAREPETVTPRPLSPLPTIRRQSQGIFYSRPGSPYTRHRAGRWPARRVATRYCPSFGVQTLVRFSGQRRARSAQHHRTVIEDGDQASCANTRIDRRMARCLGRRRAGHSGIRPRPAGSAARQALRLRRAAAAKHKLSAITPHFREAVRSIYSRRSASRAIRRQPDRPAERGSLDRLSLQVLGDEVRRRQS